MNDDYAEKVDRILDCAYKQINEETKDKYEALLMKVGMQAIMHMFVKNEVPVFDPLFIETLRKVANVLELIASETQGDIKGDKT